MKIYLKNIYIYGRNLNNFNEQEFHDELISSNWNNIFLKVEKDPQ